jgi:hypothetical protein
MRRLIAALFLLVASASAHATDPQARGGVPTWLLGKWVVTKVYEDANETYPVPSAEPEVWLGGKTMSVEPNRLSLGGEICTDFGVEPKRGTIRQILKTMSGQTPQQIGLNAKRGQVSYLKVTCGRSFTEETAERVEMPHIEWYIVVDDREKIEMAFLGGAYLELRRPTPTS